MPPDLDVRWRQRFQSFGRAFQQLHKAAELARHRELSELEQQGLIQAFEFTHELSWKLLKDFLEARGVTQIFGSRDAIREAFSAGVLADPQPWAEMVLSRNLTSHTYNEQVAEEVAAAILERFVPAFAHLEATFNDLAAR